MSTPNFFQGKSVVITGAASGIGEALSYAFANSSLMRFRSAASGSGPCSATTRSGSRVTMLSVALTVVVMPLMVLPFLVLMNDDEVRQLTEEPTLLLADLIAEMAGRTATGYLFGGLASSRGEAVQVAGVVDPEQLMQMQRLCRRSYVDPALVRYAVDLVAATREPARCGLGDLTRLLTFGASPRATIGLIEGARALAFLRGRDYVLPEDVVDLAPDVLRHRLVLSYEALSEGLSADALVAQIMAAVPITAHPAAQRRSPSFLTHRSARQIRCKRVRVHWATAKTSASTRPGRSVIR